MEFRIIALSVIISFVLWTVCFGLILCNLEKLVRAEQKIKKFFKKLGRKT